MYHSGSETGRQSSEAARLYCWALVLALLTTLPPLVGWWRARSSGLWYTGVPALNAADLTFYLSYIRQVGQGRWTFDYPLLSGVGTPMVNWVWLAIGGVGRLFEMSPLLTYHVARLLLLIPLVWAVWFAVGQALVRRSEQRAATILLLFGSGVGAWVDLVRGANRTSVPDVDVAEFTIFGSALTSPHLVVSWIFLLLVVPITIRALVERSRRLAVGAGLLSAFWFQFHPYYVPLGWAISGAFALWCGGGRWRRIPWLEAVTVVIGGLPAFAYHLPRVLGSNREWMFESNTLPAPPVAALALAVAGVLLLAPRGAGLLRARQGTAEGAAHAPLRGLSADLLVLWAVVQVFCAYLPLGFEQRLLEGLVVPLTILAAPALASQWQTWGAGATWRRLGRWPLAAVVFGSGMVHQVTTSVVSVSTPTPGVHFLPADFSAIVRWSESHLSRREVVLATPPAGHFLAGWAGTSVYVGYHWAQSRTERVRTAEVEALFRETDPSRVTEFVRSHGIHVLLLGPAQQAFQLVMARVPGARPLVRSGAYVLWDLSPRGRLPHADPG